MGLVSAHANTIFYRKYSIGPYFQQKPMLISSGSQCFTYKMPWANQLRLVSGEKPSEEKKAILKVASETVVKR